MAGRDLAPAAVIAMACGDDNGLANHDPIEVHADEMGKGVSSELHHLGQRDPERLDHQPVDFVHLGGGDGRNELCVGGHWANPGSDQRPEIAQGEKLHTGGPVPSHDYDRVGNQRENPSAGPHRSEVPLSFPCVTRRSPSGSQITMYRCSVTIRRAWRNRPSVLVTVSRVAPIMLAMS